MFSFPGTSLAAFYFSGIEPEPPPSTTNVEECGEPSSTYSSLCAARPSPSGNDPFLNTGPSPSMESSSSSISRPLSGSGCSLPNPALSKLVLKPCEMRKLISNTFDFVDNISCARHSYYHCLEQNCRSVSNLDASCMERKINSRTNDSLIESSHTATRLDFFGFYMLKARECTAFSASSTKQEINKTKLIYSLGNLERDIRNLHYNHMLTLIVTRQPLKQSYCRKILSLLKDWQIKLLRETRLRSLLLCQHISWQNMRWPTPNCCPFINFLTYLE